jgi:hypothetical protein
VVDGEALRNLLFGWGPLIMFVVFNNIRRYRQGHKVSTVFIRMEKVAPYVILLTNLKNDSNN